MQNERSRPDEAAPIAIRRNEGGPNQTQFFQRLGSRQLAALVAQTSDPTGRPPLTPKMGKARRRGDGPHRPGFQSMDRRLAGKEFRAAMKKHFTMAPVAVHDRPRLKKMMSFSVFSPGITPSNQRKRNDAPAGRQEFARLRQMSLEQRSVFAQDQQRAQRQADYGPSQSEVTQSTAASLARRRGRASVLFHPHLHNVGHMVRGGREISHEHHPEPVMLNGRQVRENSGWARHARAAIRPRR